MRKNPLGHAHSDKESFIWPGGYTTFADGEVYTRLQLETDQARQHRARGELTKRAIAPNHTIQLTNYPRDDQNKKFLVVSVTYLLQENVQASIGVAGKPETQGMAEGGSIQKFSMEVHPVEIVYRPELVTPLPRTYGPQTAVVVGPASEEIWVDKWGRVKVQFQFDRDGKMNENSSCWVRVSTTWAGPRMGHISIPRIGMCVLVDFLNGNPDYPVIIGCLYDGDNMPPWELPANATQSGIKTKSSKGGAFGDGLKAGPGDANIINFEDKAGAELLTVHAQKDFLSETENDESKWVGRDRVKHIDRDETTVVGRDRTETVQHDETITVHNNRSERVDVNEKISIGVNRDEDVGVSETVSIGVNQTFSVGVNRTKSVGVTEMDSIGKKWGINVGKIKMESIGLFSMQNIGVAGMQTIGVGRMDSVGVAYMLNVGMMMNTTVGMNQSTKVGTKYSLKVGGGGAGSGGGGGATTPGINGGSSGFVADSSGGAGGGAAAGGGGGGGGGSSLTMDADSIKLNVGEATLVMKKDGTITLNGQDISLSAKGKIAADAGSTITESAGGDVVVSGANIHLN